MYTTTTTSTTIRGIWGVERCCCPTGETETITIDTKVATPINFDSLEQEHSLTVDDFVDIRSTLTPQVIINPTPTSITLHLFENVSKYSSTFLPIARWNWILGNVL